MIIELKKFGITLTSRQLGKEAFLAFKPVLRELSTTENIEVDFAGVNTFSPSWADEFLTELIAQYGERVFLKSSDNLSVQATLKLLESISGTRFQMLP